MPCTRPVVSGAGDSPWPLSSPLSLLWGIPCPFLCPLSATLAGGCQPKRGATGGRGGAATCPPPGAGAPCPAGGAADLPAPLPHLPAVGEPPCLPPRPCISHPILPLCSPSSLPRPQDLHCASPSAPTQGGHPLTAAYRPDPTCHPPTCVPCCCHARPTRLVSMGHGVGGAPPGTGTC